jgi:hypothetical protein
MDKFRTAINRPHTKGCRDWNIYGSTDSNTVCSDGWCARTTNYISSVSNRRIIRDYLHTYQLDNISFPQPFPTWMEVFIEERPGTVERVSFRYYVKVEPNCRFAVVRDSIPYGGIRNDGYRYTY